MEPDRESVRQPPRDLAQVRKFLHQVSLVFRTKPFTAFPFLRGGHAQTLGGYAWPRRRRLNSTVLNDEERLFRIDKEINVLAHCRWQNDRTNHPTMVIWHGMEGSTSSVYMWSIADKAFRVGFNVIRVNYRNCGGTEHLTPTLYHGGLSEDLRSIVEELITKDGLKRIFPVGFSLGGNMVLKFAGEYFENPPKEVVAVVAVSPSVDLKTTTEALAKNSNWLYHKNFVISLKRRMKKKHELFPDQYSIEGLDQVKTIREFDELITSRANGFLNAEDYYFRASSIRVVDKIRIPTLVIHSKDDPFIPFNPLQEGAFTDNPYLLVITTESGGHVAFISDNATTEDRFWAENRIVEFCSLAETELPA